MASLQNMLQDQKKAEEQEKLRKIQEEMEKEKKRKDEEERIKKENEENSRKYDDRYIDVVRSDKKCLMKYFYFLGESKWKQGAN